MDDETRTASEGHTPDTASVATANRFVRRGSLIAGVALLLMVPLAAFANFVVLEGVITPGSGARTASAILAAEGAFRLAIASLFVVAVLDLVVAWALYVVFEPVSSGVALFMAWLRIVSAGVFMVAISQLAGVLSVLTTAGPGSAFSTEQYYAQALFDINAFYDIWDAALILVGAHLVVLGYLMYRSGTVPSYQSGWVPTVLGVLLAVAGVGYVFDSFARVLVAGYSVEVAAFTFLGEVLLIFWLFLYGRRIRPDEEAASAVD